MRGVLRRVSERLAGLVVSKVDAGACVPEHGTCCTTNNRRFDCYGNCVYSHDC
jgi:hypothetical protein